MVELKSDIPERLMNINRFTVGLFSKNFSHGIYVKAKKI
jgi:hypothetical protein